MKVGEIHHKAPTYIAAQNWRAFQNCRRPATDDQASSPLHQVEFGADHQLVLAKNDRLRSWLVNGRKPGEDLEFTPHVVRCFDGVAERRTAKDKLLAPGFYE